MIRARVGLVCLLPAAALALAGCSKQTEAVSAPPAVPVLVATSVQKTIPVEVKAIGTVEAYSNVAVKAQVSGELVAVHFREGEDVKAGQPLFGIDRRPFEVALQQAEANLARDQARLENARVQAQRYAKLFEEGVASREQFDQARTDAEALDAAVRADRAAVEKAKLDLQYCSIVAPLGGRTGSLIVHQGNLVKANDDPALVVINQMSPIYVNFSLPEQYLGPVRAYRAAGKLHVEAVIPDDTGAPERGEVTFIDNTVDSATGTIRLKATFPNPQRRLWPGQFVNVALRLTAEPNAIVVPAPAVQTGQSGTYVFVVKPDRTVEMRPVETGRTYQTEVVILEGLAAGETVVTDGQLRLVPGSRVEVKSGLASN